MNHNVTFGTDSLNAVGDYPYKDVSSINADKTYRVTVSGTSVRIGFNGEKDLTACLADALNAMSLR